MVDFPKHLSQPEKTSGLDADGKYQAPSITWTATPNVKPLPDAQALLDMPNAQLMGYLQEYRIIDSWESYVIDAQKYVTKMTGLAPGAPGYEDRIRQLTDGESRRSLLGMTRRASERWQTLEAIEGNINQEMIRISEGDDAVCDACAELAGTIATYTEHMQTAPGSGSCYGGDYCRCQLVVVGRE